MNKECSAIIILLFVILVVGVLANWSMRRAIRKNLEDRDAD